MSRNLTGLRDGASGSGKPILKLILGHRHTRTNTDFHYFLTKYHLKDYRVIGFEGDLNQEEFMYLWDEN